MTEFVDYNLMGELLAVSSMGFIFGMLVPFVFRLIGYLADVVFVVFND